MAKASTADEVFRIVSEQLSIDTSKLTRESSLTQDLGADSLDTVEIIMEVEDEFDINITDEETEKILTIGQLVDLVEQRR